MREDLTGHRYGRLTACREIKQAEKGRRHYWLCRCDCGNEKVVEESHLKTGHTKSCGCYRRELPTKRWVDLTGRKFGRLTVLSKVERAENTDEYWECLCSCGVMLQFRKKTCALERQKAADVCRWKHEKKI